MKKPNSNLTKKKSTRKWNIGKVFIARVRLKTDGELLCFCLTGKNTMAASEIAY